MMNTEVLLLHWLVLKIIRNIIIKPKKNNEIIELPN